MPGGAQEAPFLAQVLAAAGVDSRKITYLGSGQWDDPAVTGESTLNGALYPAPDNTGFAGFAQRYQATFGADVRAARRRSPTMRPASPPG